MEPSLEPAPLPRSVDVAIVGGGVVGIACALELTRRGAQVLVLERDRVGHGCSFGNAGWLTPSLALPLANPSVVFKSFVWLLDPESPLYIQPRLEPAFLRWLAGFLLASRRDRFERGAAALIELCRVSVDLWEELARRSPERFGFERHGMLHLYEHLGSLEAARPTVELLARNGVRAELWSADDVREREPAIAAHTERVRRKRGEGQPPSADARDPNAGAAGTEVLAAVAGSLVGGGTDASPQAGGAGAGRAGEPGPGSATGGAPGGQRQQPRRGGSAARRNRPSGRRR